MSEKNTKAKKTKVIIDVDKVIKAWNTANPDKKELDRAGLSALMEQKGMKTHTQTFSDWKRGKAHQMIAKIEFLKDLAGFGDYGDFISSVDDNAENAE